MRRTGRYGQEPREGQAAARGPRAAALGLGLLAVGGLLLAAPRLERVASGSAGGAGGAGSGGPIVDSTQGAGWAHAGAWPLPALPPEPLDLALDDRGGLWVADARNRAVLRYAPGATLPAETWERPAEIDALAPEGTATGDAFPYALALDPERDRAYVAWAEIVPPGGRFRQGLAQLFLETRDLDGRRLNVARRQGGYPLTADLGAVVDLAIDPADGALLASVAGFAEWLDPADGATRQIARLGRQDELSRLDLLPGGDLLVASPWIGAVLRYDRDGALVSSFSAAEGGRVPRALRRDGQGRIHVLLGGPPEDPTPLEGGPLLARYDESGALLGLLRAEELGATPPAGPWPWALALASAGQDSGPDAGWALSTGGARLSILRGRGEAATETIAGAEGRVAWSAERALADPALAEGIAIAPAPGGGLAALEASAAQATLLDPAGRPTATCGLEAGAIDLALDAEGALYTAGEAALRRYPACRDLVAPSWTITPGLGLPGRVAAGDEIWLADLRARAVRGFGRADGASAAQGPARPDAAGLWPSDLALAPDGRLLVADGIEGRVEAWDPAAPGRAAVAMPVGLLAGPRRLAAGRLDDGSPAFAALLADGEVELHGLLPAGSNLLARFQPRLPDGEALRADDIALREGAILLSDRASREIHRFLPGAGGTPTPPPEPLPTPTPGEGACRIQGDKVAAPARIQLGATARVTLTLAADCPGRARVTGADIVLLLDRSGSMQGDKLEAARRAAATFLELLDLRHHRAAVISFHSRADVDAPLSAEVDPVLDALAGLAADGGTNLEAALRAAEGHLAEAGRPDALPVVILLSDGRHTEEQGDPAAAAAALRGLGIQIYAIGLGLDVDGETLRRVAGGDERYFAAPRPVDLFPIYAEILRTVVSSLAGNLIVEDALDAEIALLAGSSAPPAFEQAGRLQWGRSLLPTSGITLSYEVRPQLTGRWPVGRAAASYTDGDGARRSFLFPLPRIEVVAPPGSPTPSPEPTATPGPPPRPLYLPIVQRGHCTPGAARADVALVVDVSSSMAGAKLAAAREAASAFVAALALPRDRAAVVAFDAAPRRLAGLSGNRARIEAALGQLRSGQGTRIDLALREAAAVLRDGAAPGRRPVVVLLTDGAQSGEVAAVLQAARELRRDGAALYAIGLGADVDEALLLAVADAGGYAYAPTPAELAAIYREIAAEIPCR